MPGFYPFPQGNQTIFSQIRKMWRELITKEVTPFMASDSMANSKKEKKGKEKGKQKSGKEAKAKK